jgi:CheY-like chemotaxis protein
METPTQAKLDPFLEKKISDATSELNNLLQIISNTHALMEREANVSKVQDYRAMLRSSVERAEAVAAELARQAGGVEEKAIQHSGLDTFEIPKEREQPGRKRSLLVVDDEPMALVLMDRILTDVGFDVTTAESGFAAVDALRKSPFAYDLVLLDLTMPFMDGEETLARLREIRAEIPVVLCTGFIQQQRLDQLMKAGLSGFMRKPIGPDEVVAIVRSTLARIRYGGAGVTQGFSSAV